MEARSEKSTFLFWQRWLFYSSLIFALGGIVAAFNGTKLVFLQYDKMIAEVLWRTTQFPPEAELFRIYISGPLGGTIACCYILLAFIAHYPFKEKQVWARNAIIVSFGCWFVIDSSVCLSIGAYPQVYIINAFSLIVKALPVIFTWKDFQIRR